MADIIFPCPSCKSDIQCDDSFRGKKIQCPICSNTIMVVLPVGDGGKRLGVATPGGDKNKPFVPMLQQSEVVHRKSAGGKKALTFAVVLLLLAAVGFVGYTMGWHKEVAKLLGKGGQDEAANAAPAPLPTDTESQAGAPAAAPVPVVWTTNLAEAAVPSAAASGKVSEMTFKVDSAKIDNGILVLRHGTNQIPDLEVGVITVGRPGEDVSGKKINVAKETRTGIPRVWKRWKPEGKPRLSEKVYASGYVMKLELGQVSGDQVSGKIYLALPDETESVVAGTFNATIGQTAISQSATPAAQPAQSQMSEAMRERYGLRGSGTSSRSTPSRSAPR
jgi:hypothetical protein